jgi:hypothetical protein
VRQHPLVGGPAALCGSNRMPPAIASTTNGPHGSEYGDPESDHMHGADGRESAVSKVPADRVAIVHPTKKCEGQESAKASKHHIPKWIYFIFPLLRKQQISILVCVFSRNPSSRRPCFFLATGHFSC